MIRQAESPKADPGDGMPGAPALDIPRERLWLFPKIETGELSSDFDLREFKCRCKSSRCHMTLVHPKLVESLQTLRDALARPLMLISAFRCTPYNRIVGGKPRSYHTRGMAADVLCQDLDQVRELAEAAGRVGAIGGIGEYPIRRFVHIDVRPREYSGLPTRWSA
jgi:hypothetical protein